MNRNDFIYVVAIDNFQLGQSFICNKPYKIGDIIPAYKSSWLSDQKYLQVSDFGYVLRDDFMSLDGYRKKKLLSILDGY